MINERSLARFEPLGARLLKPIYADYSFGNIANTVHFLLTREKLGSLLPEDCFGGAYPEPKKVVLFFLDAFGWQSWQRYGEDFAPTRRVINDGVLTPISALFPSTTTASVSTMNLGVLPARHALYEWLAYIPEYGEVIQTLPFMPLGSRTREACLAAGHDPAKLLAVHETVYQRLARHGVRSFQFMDEDIVTSSYNAIVSKGAELVPIWTLAEGMLKLRRAIEAAQDKSYFYFYWPSIDSIAHKHCVGSDFHAAEVAAYWQTFEAILSGVQSPDTLFLFIADHDQIAGRSEDTAYINEQIPQLADILPTSPTGKPIYPNGSARNLFLHVKPERREETLGLLRQRYSAIAEIMTVDDALALGLFGPEPVSPVLRPRLGDILVLPHDGQYIFWREPGIMENSHDGNHGGLAASELITVFGVCDRI